MRRMGGAPHPHRFRHTFVRLLLQHGVSTADVAELIGDTEEMVRKHYARWVPERQERLTRILQEALTGKIEPPKLVAIPGRRSPR
jgi:integrase